MKNKKVLITMMVVITILLTFTIIGIILNNVNGNIIKTSNKSVTENIEQNEQIQKLENTNINENNNIENTENTENGTKDNNENKETTKVQNIQEDRIEMASRNDMIDIVSSRSMIERSNVNPVYVKMNETTQNDYEELKTYIPLSEVKISFNMDVSKTTGLSQEDFVILVTNMKYDRTGILEKNAAWIWECCQKYNVNEIFVLGICGIESGWCSAKQHQNTHNYSSLMSGGKLIPYATDEQGFEAMIKLLGQKYLTPGASLYRGATITGVGTCYCNTTTWPGKVYKCMTQVFE